MSHFKKNVSLNAKAMQKKLVLFYGIKIIRKINLMILRHYSQSFKKRNVPFDCRYKVLNELNIFEKLKKLVSIFSNKSKAVTNIKT